MRPILLTTLRNQRPQWVARHSSIAIQISRSGLKRDTDPSSVLEDFEYFLLRRVFVGSFDQRCSPRSIVSLHLRTDVSVHYQLRSADAGLEE